MGLKKAKRHWSKWSVWLSFSYKYIFKCSVCLYFLFLTLFYYSLSLYLSLTHLSHSWFSSVHSLPPILQKIFFTVWWWWRTVISRLVAWIMSSPVWQCNRMYPTKHGSFTPSYSVTQSLPWFRLFGTPFWTWCAGNKHFNNHSLC